MNAVAMESKSRSWCLSMPVFRPVSGGALGAAWFLPGLWGPGLSVLLLVLLTTTTSRRTRFAVALAYYLVGSAGISAGAANFFGPGHLGLGIALWLSSATLLALPWIAARGAVGVLFAILATALPPLGMIGWLSPMTAAGVVLPGFGIIGLVVFLAIAAAIGGRHWRILVGLSIIALAANVVYSPPAPPSQWEGYTTHVHPTGSFLTEVDQVASWANEARVLRAAVTLFPEDAAGDWLTGTKAQLEAAVPAGKTWLVGASQPLGKGQWGDAIISVTPAGSHLLFMAPFTVPVSMWHPWKAGSYPILWWESARQVDGKRTWASICYSQLLPWVWVEGLLQRPELILAPRNDWWARGTGIPGIQTSSTAAWSRLVGVPFLQATNY